MTSDKTGAHTEVTVEADRFSITVDGQKAGFTEFIDHSTEQGEQRIFPHTEIDEAFSGRGLATILVSEALQATKAAGLRIAPVCSMVAGYLDKHPEFNDIVDPITTEVKRLVPGR